MATYLVKPTHIGKPAISIKEGEIDNSTALKLFGRKKLAYGKDLNENLLRLLETFACPAENNAGVLTPDKTQATDNMFDAPVEGQLWWCSSPLLEGLYVYNGTEWVEQRKFGDIGANWGVIAHGTQIPLPIAPNGRTFSYDECAWIVSPYGYPNTIDFMTCRTDSVANVTMQYSLQSSASLVGGLANYLIIGIPGNVNQGAVAPEVSVTPTPTISPTPSVTKTVTPTPTPTRAPTPTPTPTHSVTPDPTTTPSVGADPTPTPSPTPSPAPAFSIAIKQGNNTAFGDGLVLTASNATCDGFCGEGLGFAPAPDGDAFKIGIQLVGGVGPYNVTVDNWTVDPGSPNTMFGEFLEPRDNFNGAQVTGNPLNNPTWTWTGGTHSVNGMIILSAVGKCAYADKTITGSARINATDNLGNVATFTFGWTMLRTAVSGDNGCTIVS